MRKFIIAAFVLLIQANAPAASGVPVNADGSLEVSHVIHVPSASKTDLYTSVLENFTSKASLPSSNFIVSNQSEENGNVRLDGRLFLGSYKPMDSFVLGGALDVWAIYSLTVRCKDGKVKYQCIVSDVVFHRMNDQTTDRDVIIPISRCWPVFTDKKASGRIKKAANECLPKVMEAMKDYMDTATETYKSEEDF